MKWKFWEKNNRPDVEFVDTLKLSYQTHPIQLARSVRGPLVGVQKEKFKEYKFAKCPGMIDYKNYGYIIPAWDDIHILANKAGVVCHVGGGGRPSNFQHARKMSVDLVHGVFKPEGGVPAQPVHCGSPWSVVTNTKGVSAFLMPAFYHSSFLDDLYVYPGIVDYDNGFTSLNFIFAPKRPCEILIKAGDPLLQVIPFRAKEIRAGFGPANDHQIDLSKSLYSTTKQFYRKHIMNSKKTSIEEIL